eukprot:618245_1
MDEVITQKQADRAQRKIIKIKTIGMNHNVLEQEFIEDNKHCHLCNADMKGPCAFPFREWMGCAGALDKSDPEDPQATPDLNHPECQTVLNKYMLCVMYFSYLFDSMRIHGNIIEISNTQHLL